MYSLIRNQGRKRCITSNHIIPPRLVMSYKCMTAQSGINPNSEELTTTDQREIECRRQLRRSERSESKDTESTEGFDFYNSKTPRSPRRRLRTGGRRCPKYQAASLGHKSASNLRAARLRLGKSGARDGRRRRAIPTNLERGALRGAENKSLKR